MVSYQQYKVDLGVAYSVSANFRGVFHGPPPAHKKNQVGPRTCHTSWTCISFITSLSRIYRFNIKEPKFYGMQDNCEFYMISFADNDK